MFTMFLCVVGHNNFGKVENQTHFFDYCSGCCVRRAIENRDHNDIFRQIARYGNKYACGPRPNLDLFHQRNRRIFFQTAL